MSGKPIAAANDIVPALIDACRQYRTLADVLRFSLVTFSDEAKTLVPMSSYDESSIPTLQVEGGTSYGKGFAEIRRRIDVDVESLKSDGYEVFRPSVFFITDGGPTDGERERTSAWEDLTDPDRRSHPNVIAFGVGDEVPTEILKQYVSHRGRAFVSKSGADAATSIRSIIEMLVMSVVASADDGSAGGTGGLQLNTDAISEDMEELV
jgi:uncharacterized protein YegL